MYKRFCMPKLLLVLLALALSGCFKEKGAQETLRSFVEERFKGNLDHNEIGEYLSGSLKSTIMAMTDEEFTNYSDLSKFKKKKFKITHSNCSIEKCFITYLISYDQLKESTKAFRVDNKKIAEMVKIEESWKIENVTNVKTYIESKEPLEVETN